MDSIPYRLEIYSSAENYFHLAGMMVVMLVFVALVFSAILRLVRAGKKSSIGEAFVFFVIFGAGLWIALQGSDCGGFGTTMIERRDPYLLTFSASSLLSAITMINLTLRR